MFFLWLFYNPLDTPFLMGILLVLLTEVGGVGCHSFANSVARGYLIFRQCRSPYRITLSKLLSPFPFSRGQVFVSFHNSLTSWFIKGDLAEAMLL